MMVAYLRVATCIAVLAIATLLSAVHAQGVPA